MKYIPRRGKTNFNVSSTSIWRELFVLVAGLLAICVSLYLVLGWTVDLVAFHISPRIEAGLGRILMPHFDAMSQEGSRRQCLQELVDRVQDSCINLPYHFRVFIVEDERINAFALPGGNIMVFSGLLEKVESENELVFILGHEMGHFVNRDHLRRLGRSLVLLAATTLILGSDSPINDLVVNTMGLTELHFSREQETEADEFGLKVLQCFYGNTCGATDFFTRIPEEQDPGRFGHYFSSHPENRRRINHLRAMADRNDCPAGIMAAVPTCLD